MPVVAGGISQEAAKHGPNGSGATAKVNACTVACSVPYVTRGQASVFLEQASNRAFESGRAMKPRAVQRGR